MATLYLQHSSVIPLPAAARVLGTANLSQSKRAADSHVLVGCRDGRVLMFDSATEHWSEWTDRTQAVSTVCYAGSTGDDDRPTCLIGRTNGEVQRVRFKRGDFADCPDARDLERLQRPGDYVTAIERLGDSRFLVSYAINDSVVYDLRAEEASPPLEDVRRIRTAVPVGGDRFVLVTHTAELFLLTGTATERMTVLKWPSDPDEGESDPQNGPVPPRPANISFGSVRPTMVFDTTVLPPPGDANPTSTSVLISTDAGLFLVVYAGTKVVGPIPIRRLGMKGSSMAIAAAAVGSGRWLWAADSLGRNHLYRTDRDHVGDSVEWPLAATCVLPSPAEQAVAIPGADSLTIWQLGRDQTIAAVRFGPRPAKPIRSWKRARASARVEAVPVASMREFSTAQSAHAWLAQIYSEEDNHAFPKSDPDLPDWQTAPEAVVADLFDPSRETARLLWSFLANPSGALAAAVLQSFPQPTAPEEHEQRKHRIRESLRLWTSTLVGTILRLAHGGVDERTISIEERSFGVLQWLDRVRRASRGQPDADVIEQCIREEEFSVRRWTFSSPPPEAHQPRLAAALRRMFDPRNVPARERVFVEERLVKESVLFDRALDLEHEIHSHAPPGLGIAFDVARTAPEEGRPHLAAVLWRHWRIGLYEIGGDEHDPSLAFLGEMKLSDGKHGFGVETRFGRGLMVWRANLGSGLRTFLLASVRRTNPSETREREYLHLYALDPCEGASHVAISCVGTPVPLDDDDTTTCFCKISDTEFFAGVRGPRGHAAVLHIKIPRRRDGSEPRIELKRRLLVRGLESGSARVHNPVSCLAKGELRGRSLVFAGCGRGQVICFEPPDFASDADLSRAVRSVDNLAVPVWSLAVHETLAGTARVFAGGGDGRIVAWQRLPDAQPHDGNGGPETGAEATPPNAPPPAFAKLWATYERAPIVQIEAFDAVLGDTEPHQKLRPIVVAISHDGRAVAFANDPTITWGSSTDPRPEFSRRPRVPGQRLARFKLRRKAFAALRIDIPEGRADIGSFLPMARFLAVDGDATVSLLALHLPKRSKIRRHTYQRIWEHWLSVLKPGQAEGPRSIEPRRLRFIESLRFLAPNLWLLPIPYLIPPLPTADSIEQLAVEAYWFPRYLRPFVRAAKAYGALMATFTAPPCEDAIAPHADAFIEGLRDALREAFELSDFFLFKEIVETVVKRFNNVIKLVCQGPDVSAHTTLSDLYLRLLREVEDACRLWLGPAPEKFGLAQILSIKNLVDGDVLVNLTNPAKVENAKPTTLQRMVGRRTQYAQRLLMSPDRLVQVETLRAVNLTLVRAAWIALWNPDQKKPEIDDYLRVLGSFAPQAVERSNDVLTAEIARAYAIAMFVSPRIAAQQALAIRDAYLSDAIVEETIRQTLLLRDLFADIPGWEDREPLEAGLLTQLLVRSAAAKRHHYMLIPPSCRLLPGVPDDTTEFKHVLKLAREFPDFELLAAAFSSLDKLLHDLHALTAHLREAPERADLSAVLRWTAQLDAEAKQLAALRKRERRADPAAEPDQSGESRPGEQRVPFDDRWPFDSLPITAEYKRFHLRFERDRALWLAALRALGQICRSYELTPDPEGPAPADSDDRLVPPALVLASRRLRRWSRTWARDPRLQDIPEPFRSMYEDAFRDFEETTAGLSSSIAIQRRLVTGILGHNLMEALDEHVLDLDQVAHVTMPIRLLDDGPPTGIRASEPAQPGTASEFARLLGAHASRARSIPKNLRTLYQLLDEDVHQHSAEVSFAELVKQAFEDRPADVKGLRDALRDHRGRPVSGRTVTHLRLILRELASNAKQHGADLPPLIEPIARGNGYGITVAMRFEGEHHQHHYERLQELQTKKLQRLIHPTGPSSHGLGLYLANLAASMVEWKLEIRTLAEKFVQFALFRKETHPKRSSRHGSIRL